MLKTISIALVLMLTFGLLAGCSSGENEKKESTSMTKETTPPRFTTPQFTGANLADYVHQIRNENDPFVTLETNMGNMTLELYKDVAPIHVDSFLARVKDGFYDSTIFHRVIDSFMIQGGGMSINGQWKQVNYTLPAEFSDLPHYEGTLSMARARDTNSASTQFFIVLQRNQATASLDHKYTVFGQLIRGYDVLHEIGSSATKAGPGGEKSVPVNPVVLIRAYVSDAEGNPVK